MTFALKEISREDGQPIEFYKFVLGGTVHSYTTAEDETTVAGIDYAPLGISHHKGSDCRDLGM